MDLDATDIAEIINGLNKDIENEKIYRSESMDSSLTDEDRIESLEDAYICHLKINRDSRIIGKKMFDKYLKVVVEKEYEDLVVLSYEEYLIA